MKKQTAFNLLAFLAFAFSGIAIFNPGSGSAAEVEAIRAEADSLRARVDSLELNINGGLNGLSTFTREEIQGLKWDVAAALRYVGQNGAGLNADSIQLAINKNRELIEARIRESKPGANNPNQ